MGASSAARGYHSLTVRRRRHTGSEMSDRVWGAFRGLDVLQQELNISAEIMSE